MFCSALTTVQPITTIRVLRRNLCRGTMTGTRSRVRKTCTRCGHDKPWGDFHAAAKWDDGTMRRPQSRCKDCLLKANNERNSELSRTAKGRRKLRARWRRKYRALRADPERRSTRNAYEREYYRANRSPNPTPSLWLENRPSAVSGIRLDTAPIRAAVERSELSPAEIARRIDRPKSTVAKGLKQETISAEMATAILDAIGVLPTELGL